ncbi:lipopolysaccharide/colanic/teichoic acid biosynthesis glycosyltransferase [Rhizobium aquaticum]|uniref:Lipopolysaccharide/colanic/teichoic acid biosynthesis glycosyltransferase n=2 Tax=Rhizobium aquaticum TaxID=1549636 RepID=A0ABV2J1T4_9HYPH
MAFKELEFARHESVESMTPARAMSEVWAERCASRSVDEKPVQMGLKRAMDIVLASIALWVLLPVLILIAIAIRLTSPGPALFTQLRWGRNCEKIKVYKFRSMYADRGDQTGVVQTRAGDSRITPLGAVLRKTNLDELPQLINVLKGDMSLVGPRPHAIGMQAAGMLYEDLVPEYHKRHRVRPGITGLAQMRGLRGPTLLASKSRARVAADLFYVENYSLMLDIRILYRTLRDEAFGGSGF